MSNDKKRGNDVVVPLSRKPGPGETTGRRTLDESIDFGENYRRQWEVQNSLPPPDPITKKEK